jgi:hypothetical protein
VALAESSVRIVCALEPSSLLDLASDSRPGPQRRNSLSGRNCSNEQRLVEMATACGGNPTRGIRLEQLPVKRFATRPRVITTIRLKIEFEDSRAVLAASSYSLYYQIYIVDIWYEMNYNRWWSPALRCRPVSSGGRGGAVGLATRSASTNSLFVLTRYSATTNRRFAGFREAHALHQSVEKIPAIIRRRYSP